MDDDSLRLVIVAAILGALPYLRDLLKQALHHGWERYRRWRAKSSNVLR